MSNLSPSPVIGVPSVCLVLKVAQEVAPPSLLDLREPLVLALVPAHSVVGGRAPARIW